MKKCFGMIDFTANSDVTKFSSINESDDIILFDFNYSGDIYSVRLEQNNGSLYKGKARKKGAEKDIPLTARVLRDKDEGIIFISGEWSEPGFVDHRWFVDITLDD